MSLENVDGVRTEAYFFCRFLELVVAALLRVKLGQRRIPEHLAALRTFDALIHDTRLTSLSCEIRN